MGSYKNQHLCHSVASHKDYMNKLYIKPGVFQVLGKSKISYARNIESAKSVRMQAADRCKLSEDQELQASEHVSIQGVPEKKQPTFNSLLL